MGGAKSKYIATSELYAATDSGKPRRSSMRGAPAFDAVSRPTTSPRGTGIGARVSRSSETSPCGLMR